MKTDDSGARRSDTRKKNWRVAIVGVVLLVVSLAFYLFMLSIASRSNDPAALMETAGTVAGVVGGIGLAMSVVGLVGKRG